LDGPYNNSISPQSQPWLRESFPHYGYNPENLVEVHRTAFLQTFISANFVEIERQVKEEILKVIQYISDGTA
jgi:hypothetical protein